MDSRQPDLSLFAGPVQHGHWVFRLHLMDAHIRGADMTLTQISDASQAVAAFAVVASLIILILQNRQANALKREEATRRQMEGIQNISRLIFETPGMADVWGRGISNFEALSNEDKIKFLTFVTYTHRVWEAMYQEFLRGQLDEGIWRAHARMLQDVQALSGVKLAWTLRKHVFSDTFQDFYERNAAQAVVTDLYGLDAGDKEQPVEIPT